MSMLEEIASIHHVINGCASSSMERSKLFFINIDNVFIKIM